MSLQERGGAFVGVGGVVVATHAFLEGKGLVKAAEHVGVVALRLVVVDDASLP